MTLEWGQTDSEFIINLTLWSSICHLQSFMCPAHTLQNSWHGHIQHRQCSDHRNQSSRMFESSSSGVLASASGAFNCCWAIRRGFPGRARSLLAGAGVSVHLTPSSLLAQLFLKPRVSFSSALRISYSLHKQQLGLYVSNHRFTPFPGREFIIMCLHCTLPSMQALISAMLRKLADMCMFCNWHVSKGLASVRRYHACALLANNFISPEDCTRLQCWQHQWQPSQQSKVSNSLLFIV